MSRAIILVYSGLPECRAIMKAIGHFLQKYVYLLSYADPVLKMYG